MYILVSYKTYYNYSNILKLEMIYGGAFVSNYLKIIILKTNDDWGLYVLTTLHS